MLSLPPRITFFDLPPVIRQEIYSYLLNPARTYRFDKPVPYYDFHPALLSASHHFRQDAGDYLRMFCILIYFNFCAHDFQLHVNYFANFPVLRGLPKSLVTAPAMTVTVEGRVKDSEPVGFFAGKEALVHSIKSYWLTCIAARSKEDQSSSPLESFEELRARRLILTLNSPHLHEESQSELLMPFLRIHQSQPTEIQGFVRPAFIDLFGKQFRSNSAHINDEHYIKKFFADYSRSGRHHYRQGRFYEAYQNWDILDGYWLYLNRLSKVDSKFRSIVRYMGSVFSKYFLEMYLGCALSALHFGDYVLAREAANRAYIREPRMRVSEVYQTLISLCLCFASLCEGDLSQIQNVFNSKLYTDSAEVRDVILDLLTIKDNKGVIVAEYLQFSPWNKELEKRGSKNAIDALSRAK